MGAFGRIASSQDFHLKQDEELEGAAYAVIEAGNCTSTCTDTCQHIAAIQHLARILKARLPL